MVTRGSLVDSMAVGYAPTCQSKPGLWPCYPIVPRFGLMGLGAPVAVRRAVMPVIPRYGMSGGKMVTGRITYGSGFGRLGQTDSSSTSLSVIPDLSQSTLLQNPVSQWGWGEWAVIGGGLFILYAVFTTTKRGVGGVQEFRTKRRKRIAKEARAIAEQYE